MNAESAIRNLLQKYADLGLQMKDSHTENFGYEDGELKVLDIDSVQFSNDLRDD